MPAEDAEELAELSEFGYRETGYILKQAAWPR
jgi:hypothetical protein